MIVFNIVSGLGAHSLGSSLLNSTVGLRKMLVGLAVLAKLPAGATPTVNAFVWRIIRRRNCLDRLRLIFRVTIACNERLCYFLPIILCGPVLVYPSAAIETASPVPRELILKGGTSSTVSESLMRDLIF